MSQVKAIFVNEICWVQFKNLNKEWPSKHKSRDHSMVRDKTSPHIQECMRGWDHRDSTTSTMREAETSPWERQWRSMPGENQSCLMLIDTNILHQFTTFLSATRVKDLEHWNNPEPTSTPLSQDCASVHKKPRARWPIMSNSLREVKPQRKVLGIHVSLYRWCLVV